VGEKIGETICSFPRTKKPFDASYHGVSSAGSGIKHRFGTALLLACTHLFPPKGSRYLVHVLKDF